MDVDYNDNKTYGCNRKLVFNYDELIMKTSQWPEELNLGTHTS